MTKSWPLLLVLLLGPSLAGAAEVPIPPAPTRWVTDPAGFLSPGAQAAVEARLQAYGRSTGNQVLVWIGDTTGDTPVEEWTVRAFERWKVGQKGLDNGLVLFLFVADRKVRVEVGYGVEDRVPDVTAIRVVREVIAPRIQAGDRDGAVAAGVDALLAALGGEPEGGAGRAAPAPARKLGTGQVILFALLGIGFLILLATNPSLALYLLFSILSGGRGGGYGGGGGFSGGGGRSGGGGATGSW
jgi:uncharacterized protein